MTTPILLAIIEILLLFAIGRYSYWKGFLRMEHIRHLTRLVIDVLFPMLIFYTLVSEFERDRLHELWPLPLLGFGYVLFGLLLGGILKRFLKSQDADLRNTFQHLCAINNYGFLPILIVQQVWGTQAMANLFFIHLGTNLGVYTIGVGILGGVNRQQMIKNMFSPVFYALLIGLTVNLLGGTPSIPQILLKTCQFAGTASIPLMLIIVGASLSQLKIRENVRDLLFLTFLRLLALPLLWIGLLLLVGLPQDLYHILLIIALMPVATTSSVFTYRFGGHPRFANQAVILTTLLSLATVPTGFYLFG